MPQPLHLKPPPEPPPKPASPAPPRPPSPSSAKPLPTSLQPSRPRHRPQASHQPQHTSRLRHEQKQGHTQNKSRLQASQKQCCHLTALDNVASSPTAFRRRASCQTAPTTTAPCQTTLPPRPLQRRPTCYDDVAWGALELTGVLFVCRLSLQRLATSPLPSTLATGGGPQSGRVCLGSLPFTSPRLCAVAAPQLPSTLAPGALGNVRATSFQGGSSSVKTLGGPPSRVTRCGLVSHFCAGQLALHMALTMRGCSASTALLSDSKSRPTRWGSRDGRGREHGKVLDSGHP
jgi:hypothetical protein